MELTKRQIERQDAVDNSIFELLRLLNPTNEELQWDIEAISNVRELIRLYFERTLNGFSEQDYYPYVEE
ncbi:MAG: hypothetical protein LBB61_06310 [Treponema sp.]|jgi:hypothetical protein|nr:hypothetical protein [Treponema sp.]